VVVCSREWTRSSPELVQECKDVLRIGSKSGVKFGNRDVSDLLLLSSLFFICLEYLVERLFKGLSLVEYYRAMPCNVTLLSPAMVKERFFS
jgi:hypothetical protein